MSDDVKLGSVRKIKRKSRRQSATDSNLATDGKGGGCLPHLLGSSSHQDNAIHIDKTRIQTSINPDRWDESVKIG